MYIIIVIIILLGFLFWVDGWVAGILCLCFFYMGVDWIDGSCKGLYVLVKRQICK
jgi:hypothetical protein